MNPCPRCGEAAASDATFCTRCGLNLAAARTGGGPTAPAAGRPFPAAPVKKRRIPVWAVILIVLAGLGLLAVGAVVAAIAFFVPRLSDPSVPATHHLVFTQSGKGNADTKTFAVGDAWDLNWQYDCTTFGHNGNFSLVVEKDGTMSSEFGPNEVGHGNHGTLHFDAGAGNRSLKVISECNWTVVAYTH